MIPQSEHWRLYDWFREQAVFLDIETTGLGRDSSITVVGLSDGYETKTMIKGINLKRIADYAYGELKKRVLITPIIT